MPDTNLSDFHIVAHLLFQQPYVMDTAVNRW